MMVRRTLMALALLSFSSLFGAAMAGSSTPQIYVFGADKCGYCHKALIFLRGLQAKDSTRFQLHDYDIVRSSDEATLYARVVTAIGLNSPVVPMIIIGREVILGYESDETTGREIAGHIDACQTKECPDLIGRIIDMPGTVGIVDIGTWTMHRRWIEAGLRP